MADLLAQIRRLNGLADRSFAEPFAGGAGASLSLLYLEETPEIYVNDAFGSAHRAHASTEGVARFLPAVSGFLMEQELEYLGRATENPAHPYVAILGGAKISDKIMVVENLLSKCDTLIIGGGMANTFLAAKGYDMQGSLVEAASIETAKAIMAKARAREGQP